MRQAFDVRRIVHAADIDTAARAALSCRAYAQAMCTIHNTPHGSGGGRSVVVVHDNAAQAVAQAHDAVRALVFGRLLRFDTPFNLAH